jgi:hypothetical protein
MWRGLVVRHLRTWPAVDDAASRCIVRGGLSRVELAAVVGILCACLALIPPAIMAWRESARRSQTVSNLGRLGVAIHNEQAMRPRYAVFPDPPVESSDPSPPAR